MHEIIEKNALRRTRVALKGSSTEHHTHAQIHREDVRIELHVPASHTGLIAPSGACIQRQRSLRRSARSRAAQARAGRRPACRRARRSGWLSS